MGKLGGRPPGGGGKFAPVGMFGRTGGGGKPPGGGGPSALGGKGGKGMPRPPGTVD